MVDRRCAITIEVLPSIRRSSASNTSFSEAASSPDAGFVQNQDRRIANDGARDRDPLPLAAGKRHAALADDGVVALRHLLDEFVRVGQFGGAQNLRAARSGLAVGDVLPDRRRGTAPSPAARS